ncbi:hypothetical protein VSR01_15335 [Actinacidiphila sp. DG2A-62]|jgi:hypothetical protein|uniref:hypothetical protein n=1 Tax=Actinacidiphila sp. DG2A-62 TaxID=3108821 RepID=UPI002DBA57B3|nr:hypothetical protein [Actinacidiphila sp. DG2A-62]MEC3994822.1 hypothetical protein [Actinacidiphila sp. DG2A-62]
MTDSLPGPEFWTVVHPYTGEVSNAERTARGFSSDVTALVDCEKGPFFVKAMRNRPGGRRDSLMRERLINPFVRSVSPALCWEAESEEWTVLGFEVVEGRSSTFDFGSPDLPAVASVVRRIGEIPLPPVAQAWAETRWNRFAADEREAGLFAGDSLLYTDINPSNLLIGGGATWAVDWSWPTRGAGFIDPACLVLQLIAAGHDAKSAESWAQWCPAWVSAGPRAINAFVLANVRMYETFSKRKPEAPWLATMATAARSWSDHRNLAK